ncbi:hypothetical protein FHT40_006713 [Mycolicibacterium sp. BK556]|uniref:hypothetical protein n=1 Tax=unclassified Mycolicibacterium TaxID=2636767 RepID=UPI0016160612|nr:MULTISPECIES: hypothetical protein [unclassified Mycolicibacterium]MBB3607016.1 hypothetical protein [Mycolicibacterium sp. BK556]MBB3636771.1 hypothetical protein [Mycolicibacterium sp. BK607]MBB3747572.1 hypothetical protein [Mycolicibacterium sp. BK634]
MSFWRGFNEAANVLRRPLRRREVLLVTGDASQDKSSEVEARLRFLIAHLGQPLEVRQVRAAVPLDYVRSTAVTAADSTALAVFPLRRLRWVANLDYETNPVDGWDLMDLGTALAARRATRSAAISARQAFSDRVAKLQAEGQRPAYLFGTGPSLQLAVDRSFDDGIVVACNTIVRDQELWDHLKPDFLTAGDAIYHFGHTAHARAFRADALQRLRESNGRTMFVYPAQFDTIVRSEFRDVERLLVPIPHGDHTDISVNLVRQFRLPHLGNVLNNSLLPLGCTLSKDVRLWGFDGRAPQDTGFWANSDRHSYPELMQTIRDAHPAFFSDSIPTGNEVKYVNTVHGDLLDERLTEAESRGFTFEMLHRSWTPTLQKRYHGADANPA